MSIIGSLLLAGSIAANIFQYQTNKNLQANALVIKVIDGDTIVLQTGQNIRLGNLEAPELEFCGGKEAKDYLENLVLDKSVRIEAFAKDAFKRSIALVWQGNTLVNKEILVNGWARYDGSPSPERDQLKKSYDLAVERNLGIHSSKCKAIEPDKPDCLIKGNKDRHSDLKTYYFPGCSNYSQTIVEKDLGENWFCTEKEAENAGYVKSPNCFNKKY